jgi:predicted acyl esterase
MHTLGAIRAFNETNTDKKWLRIHPHQEWYEDYHYSSVDDLDRFFTRYLKGEENGWEATPPVRVSLLRYGETVFRHGSPAKSSILYTTKSKPRIPFLAPSTPSYS